MSADLYIYDGHLKYPFRWQDQPGAKGLGSKWTDHGFKKTALDKRVAEIDDFLGHLAQWSTKVLNSPAEKALKKPQPGAKKQVNLLSDHSTKDKRENVLSDFFKAGAGYDPARATMSFGAGAMHPDLSRGASPTMAQSMSGGEFRAARELAQQAGGRQSVGAAMTTPPGDVAAFQQQVAQQQRRGSNA